MIVKKCPKLSIVTNLLCIFLLIEVNIINFSNFSLIPKMGPKRLGGAKSGGKRKEKEKECLLEINHVVNKIMNVEWWMHARYIIMIFYFCAHICTNINLFLGLSIDIDGKELCQFLIL